MHRQKQITVMKKDIKYCQSCGMPLVGDVHGTNADGSESEEYCTYCYRGGKFMIDCTMEEMIDHCSQYYGAYNEISHANLTRDEFVAQMRELFPQLKRWRK